MGNIANKLTKVATLGLVDDVTGEEAAAKAAQQAAGQQASAADQGIAEQRRQFDATQASLQPRIEGGNLAFQQRSTFYR